MVSITLDTMAESLCRWIQSWMSANGHLSAPVVHRGNLKRCWDVHMTPWSQASYIHSCRLLFERTASHEWLNLAVQAADAQLQMLNVHTGQYAYAGYEDNRFCSLVHCSMANLALLRLAKTLRQAGRHAEADRFIEAAVCCVNRYLIPRLWVESFGAFRMVERDYYSTTGDRFIANMNCLMLETLFEMSDLGVGDEYGSYIDRVGQWLPTQQDQSPGQTGGGIAYSHVQPDILIAIYTALCLPAVAQLHLRTGAPVYHRMLIRTVEHLQQLTDLQNGIYDHGYYHGRRITHPQFVAGSGLIGARLHQVQAFVQEDLGLDKLVQSLLPFRLDNGAYQNFVGCNTPDNFRQRGSGEIVWEDVFPTAGWNVHLLEMMVRMGARFMPPSCTSIPPVTVNGRTFRYHETTHWVELASWWPPRSMGMFVFRKGWPYAPVCVNPSGVWQGLGRLKQRLHAA